MFAKQRREHPALGHPPFPGGFEHQLEQVQDLAVLDPPGHLAEQQVMSHGVEIGRQIHVDHPRLAVDDALLHPGHRRMRRPPRAIPVRPVTEVRFEHGLQDELERTLDHPVPDRRNPQHADLAPALGNLDAPVPQRPIGACDQFVPQPRQKRLHARRPRSPRTSPRRCPGPRCSAWRASYAARSVSSLATWTYRPQNRFVLSAFAVT